MNTPQMAFRLNEADKKILSALAKKKGVNATAVVKMAIREMATREGVTTSEGEETE